MFNLKSKGGERNGRWPRPNGDAALAWAAREDATALVRLSIQTRGTLTTQFNSAYFNSQELTARLPACARPDPGFPNIAGHNTCKMDTDISRTDSRGFSLAKTSHPGHLRHNL
jgi:hypothetical protein